MHEQAAAAPGRAAAAAEKGQHIRSRQVPGQMRWVQSWHAGHVPPRACNELGVFPGRITLPACACTRGLNVFALSAIALMRGGACGVHPTAVVCISMSRRPPSCTGGIVHAVHTVMLSEHAQSLCITVVAKAMHMVHANVTPAHTPVSTLAAMLYCTCARPMHAHESPGLLNRAAPRIPACTNDECNARCYATQSDPPPGQFMTA